MQSTDSRFHAVPTPPPIPHDPEQLCPERVGQEVPHPLPHDAMPGERLIRGRHCQLLVQVLVAAGHRHDDAGTMQDATGQGIICTTQTGGSRETQRDSGRVMK